MDKLLYDFYTCELYINATRAEEEEVRELQDIINLQWRSGDELSKLMDNFSGTCYLYCAEDLYLIQNWYETKKLDETEIMKKINRSRNYVYWTHLVERTRNKQVMSIRDFINHFARPLKPVSEKELENIW